MKATIPVSFDIGSTFKEDDELNIQVLVFSDKSVCLNQQVNDKLSSDGRLINSCCMDGTASCKRSIIPSNPGNSLILGSPTENLVKDVNLFNMSARQAIVKDA
ncbi:unnamed protein product [Ambrosiozyma monospora]|uniref:Unnamed protein product n=1 Tax=Ambrosiozyma monospora TaxID=43982 RepID=A0A9W6YLD3_AMBMO|nr:unnamed protein product [Ambrosiozyma monospora]